MLSVVIFKLWFWVWVGILVFVFLAVFVFAIDRVDGFILRWAIYLVWFTVCTEDWAKDVGLIYEKASILMVIFVFVAVFQFSVSGRISTRNCQP